MSARLAIATAALVLCASLARAETFLIQSGEDSSPYAFTPGLARGFRNTAYAFTNSLDGEDHSFEYYIRFNLPPELFEPGVTVDYAYAWVYYGYDYTLFEDTTDEVGQLLCHEALASWSQSTLTWNNRPPIGPVIDGWDDVTEKGIYWCDITELVQGWVSGQIPNRGIAFTSGELRVIGFYTWDTAGVSPNFKPSLLVETLPEPRAGLWAGAALLLVLARGRMRRLAPQVD
jgi:hypothetical protein